MDLFGNKDEKLTKYSERDSGLSTGLSQCSSLKILHFSQCRSNVLLKTEAIFNLLRCIHCYICYKIFLFSFQKRGIMTAPVSTPSKPVDTQRDLVISHYISAVQKYNKIMAILSAKFQHELPNERGIQFYEQHKAEFIQLDQDIHSLQSEADDCKDRNLIHKVGELVVFYYFHLLYGVGQFRI
jgi:hypothetical protein